MGRVVGFSECWISRRRGEGNGSLRIKPRRRAVESWEEWRIDQVEVFKRERGACMQK